MLITLRTKQAATSVILLPLRPASLRHKNPQRHNEHNLWYASHRTQRSIDRSKDVFGGISC